MRIITRAAGSVFRPLRPVLTLLPLLIAGCSSGGSGSAGQDFASGEPRVLPEHYAHSIAALGHPGARRAFQVGDGSVVYAGDAALEWRLTGDTVHTSPVYFERDGVPVAHWYVTSPAWRIHFEAAAAPHPALGDTALLLSVNARVECTDGDAPARLELRVLGEPDGPHAVPWDARPEATANAEWRDHGAYRDDALLALIDPRAQFAEPGDGDTLQAFYPLQMQAGDTQDLQFLMPIYPATVDAGTLRGVAHAGLIRDARRYWRDMLAQGAQFESPDTLLNAAWSASLVTLLQCQERFDADWVSIGNPFQYRDVWIRDGARVVRALAVAGYTERARQNAWAFRRYQLPHGVFLSQRGQLDGTGQAMWAMAQAATIPPDRATARRFMPVMERGFRWVEQQRSLSRRLDLTWAGLLPFADPRDAELTRAQLIGNDAWAIAGHRALAAVADLAGDDTLALAATRAYDDYRARFGEALAATGRADLPPAWQAKGVDWGNASIGYPTRVLAPEDPHIARTAERMGSVAAPIAIAHWGTADSLHSYLGADLAQWALLAGRAQQARAYVRDLLAWSSSTLGQAEVFVRPRGTFAGNLPPHTTAAATLVDLMRNMIISDVRDTVELGLGLDLAMWNGTDLRGAPTRFGRIDVSFTRPASDVLEVQWGSLATPVRIRVPDGATARSTDSPGVTVLDARWLECAPGTTHASFTIEQVTP